MALATTFYYIQELIPNVKMVMNNSSWSYKLPYKTRTFIDIRDIRIYTCLCIYQMLIPPCVVLGFVGFDCLFTNLAFHITAQFAILSCILREILDDSNGFQRNIRELVLRHYKLISTLFIYCYIGECLIQESTNLSHAFYRYEWYNVSPINLKMVNICMLRMKKPQQLTSGKFFVLSLASFTDILKTSMGYLSLLRTLI
ncbi:odorant receptor 22c-like [Vespula pensylvanica]|uniref:odorant receptor 22c-like n=1 Tax=Vespula pensylvanica TaxID=30213 RepID=UPI001CBA232E|nr:odorant receptor 22c-like [Vespula pensylvanica]